MKLTDIFVDKIQLNPVSTGTRLLFKFDNGQAKYLAFRDEPEASDFCDYLRDLADRITEMEANPSLLPTP